ncbi:sensor histidine kinase [Lysinibacillus piscis]|uniref:histidine kinase n=1 Tax=Lysinibacillus piscis TaxID=2518931 RepID=A0ABQ5NI62_9BACI|nr:HAMP domain-containing sensor histidine kinase [Lysinibacillus sp. KH24]GLC88060.1 hypothetical protein LYSBPC_11870 [Lysinibacillus sp. KH24]
MKNQTKMWLLIIISIFSSLIIFIAASFIMGDFGNKGYDIGDLKTISNEVLTTIDQQEKGISSILDAAHAEHPAVHFEWIQADGTAIYNTAGTPQNYDFQQLADHFLSIPYNLWTEGETISLVYKTHLQQQPYYLLMKLPSTAMQPGQVYFFLRTTKVLLTLLLPLIIAFMVPYLLAIWFFSRMNRRIHKLNHALTQVNLQKDIIVLQDTSKDEIGQLTQHYNSMVERIQSQVIEIEQFDNKRKQLLSNLSHDLRTPLTMILGYAETIRNGLYKDDRELQSSAKIILQRSRYMDKLLDQLLDITRQNTHALTLQLAPHNISEMLRKILADYLLFLDGQDYIVDVHIEDTDIMIHIDVALMERAIRNIIDNALRYGKEGHYLGIILKEQQNDVWITIKDKGPGIASAEQERIFERFYRVHQGRQGDGLGIGLSIVQEIVDLHQASIHVTSVPYEETLFQIRLPKKEDELN